MSPCLPGLKTNNMKKLVSLLLASFIALAATAQLKVDLVLSATPPATLSEWANRREVLTAVVSGQPGLPPVPVKIKTEIKTTDGTVIGYTDLARAATFTVGSSSATIYTATEVMPLEIMIFTGKYKSSLQRSGKLPSDNYSLCVQLVRPTDYTPVSQPVVCKSFYLAATQLPTLMKPYNEEVLDANKAQTAITFRWTPALPRTASPVTYRLQVFEILDKQSPVQALRSNQPLVDQEIRGTTQYIWRPQMSFYWLQPGDLDGDGTFDEAGGIKIKESETGKDNKTVTPKPDLNNDRIKQNSHGFIWTIQTLDDHGLPVTQTDGSGEARSEPIVFYVKMKVKEKMNR